MLKKLYRLVAAVMIPCVMLAGGGEEKGKAAE